MSKQTAITVKRQAIDVMSLGNAFAGSGYFSDATQQSQAVVKILAGQELGLGPMASMSGIHIIQGKPSLSSNMMAAVIKNHPVYDYKVKENTAERVTLEFYADNELLGVSDFSMEDAKTAELSTGKNKHSWKKFPRNMLFARALSNGAKWYCPDAFSGVAPYTPDELDAVIDGDSGEVIEGEPTGYAHTGEVYPSDDTSIWLPSLAEFQAQCENDFSMDWNTIKGIIKNECGYDGFKSDKATEIYKCLVNWFNNEKQPETTPEEDLAAAFPVEQPSVVVVQPEAEPVTYE